MRLSVLFVRPTTGTTMHRALASLEGAASEAVKFTGVPEDVEPFRKACQLLSIMGAVPNDTFPTVQDVSTNFGGMLSPDLCRGWMIPTNLSSSVNASMKFAEGDYILLMSPSEVCLDPLNIERTLDYLDTKPQISVVSCPTKIYEGGDHVRTAMTPKLIRRGSVEMTGLLADNWFPCNDQNWLINASGLEFMDLGDAVPNQSLLDLKILLLKQLQTDGPVPRDEVVALAERFIPWNVDEALRLVARSSRLYAAGSTESVKMLIVMARAGLADRIYDYAIAHATEAIAILPSPAAHLVRGFARCGIEMGWEEDLRHAVELARQTTSYGLDLRELRLAELVLRWLDNPGSRCLSNHDNGIDIPCLVAPGHQGKHVGIHKGLRVEWETPDYCLDCGAPIVGGHGDCQNT